MYQRKTKSVSPRGKNHGQSTMKRTVEVAKFKALSWHCGGLVARASQNWLSHEKRPVRKTETRVSRVGYSSSPGFQLLTKHKGPSLAPVQQSLSSGGLSCIPGPGTVTAVSVLICPNRLSPVRRCLFQHVCTVKVVSGKLEGVWVWD